MDKLLGVLSNPAVVTVVAMLLESLLRLVPTKKPASILLAVSKIVHMGGSVIDALAAFLDKVLPQNLSSQ